MQVITRALRYSQTWPTDPAEEKGIDVALAIDFVRFAIYGVYDVGVIMSTDSACGRLSSSCEAIIPVSSASPSPPGESKDMTSVCAFQTLRSGATG